MDKEGSRCCNSCLFMCTSAAFASSGRFSPLVYKDKRCWKKERENKRKKSRERGREREKRKRKKKKKHSRLESTDASFLTKCSKLIGPVDCLSSHHRHYCVSHISRDWWPSVIIDIEPLWLSLEGLKASVKLSTISALVLFVYFSTWTFTSFLFDV